MKNSRILIIVPIIVIAIALIFFVYKVKSSPKKTINIEKESSLNYNIKNTYYLPDILEEVSGIVWISDHTFACIQDEDGFIFIYDTKQSTIINDIKFAGSGDYEGIAINQDDAYVLRSDGLIYEILNYNSESRKISEIKTSFTADNNVESLTFDKQNKRLLIIPKDKDLGEKRFKCIYQIPLGTKEFDHLPLLKIDLKSDKLKEFQHKRIERTLNPSDIAIHPITNDIYVLEGKDPKLLILNTKGELLRVLLLDKRKFAQPEGITFSNNGNLFISNEANDDWANILEVELK